MHSSCPLVVDQNAQTYNLQVLQHEMRHRCVRILDFCISATPADGVETSSLFTLSIFHPELSFPPQNFWERRTCIGGHIGCKCCWSVHIRHALALWQSSFHSLAIKRQLRGPPFAYLHTGERRVQESVGGIRGNLYIKAIRTCRISPHLLILYGSFLASHLFAPALPYYLVLLIIALKRS